MEVSCDVCSRTLLRGEFADIFLVNGDRKNVCDLCTLTAHQAGWVPESTVERNATTSRAPRESRGASFIDRWRTGRKRADDDSVPQEHKASVELESITWEELDNEAPRPRSSEAREAIQLDSSEQHSSDQIEGVTYTEREVSAVPSSVDLKLQKALELFNDSVNTRRIAGLARSLGEPEVCVLIRDDELSVALMAVMWELSWYRFEVDLSLKGAEVRCVGQGSELSELSSDERKVNASADANGHLTLLSDRKVGAAPVSS